MSPNMTESKSEDNVDENTPLLPSSSSSSSTPKSQTSPAPVNGLRRRVSASSSRSQNAKAPLEPVQALAPLVTGGTIKTTDGITTSQRSLPLVKSIPASPPRRSTARHHSYSLKGLNNFRHGYKNTRLALKFGGTVTYARDKWEKMASLSPLHKKSLLKMEKIMKRLGQGASMKYVLRFLSPFTNTLRITMVILRTLECSVDRRLEVGTEETMVSNSVTKVRVRVHYFSLSHDLFHTNRVLLVTVSLTMQQK